MKRLNKLNRNFTLRTYINGKMAHRVETHKLGRFSHHVQATDFSQPGVSVYLRVSEGEKTDVFGNLVNFYNDGTYKDKESLMQAYHAFIET